MHVCSTGGADPEGNVCDWSQCGLYTGAPSQFFGGCSGTTAGTVCIPNFAPANACTSVKSCPKWENGIVRIPATGTQPEPTTIFGDGVRHLHAVCHGLVCDPPVIDSGSISNPGPQDCAAAAATRSNQLKAAVGVAIAAEANFDSVAALNQRVAEAQALVGATWELTIQAFNVFFTPVGPPNNPNALLLERWDERWICQNNVVDATPATAANDACGCNN